METLDYVSSPLHLRSSLLRRVIFDRAALKEWLFVSTIAAKREKTSFLLGIVGLLFNGMLLAIYIIYYDEIQRSICESEFGTSNEIIAREPRWQRQSSADRFRDCEKYLVSNETETVKDLLRIEIKYWTLSSFDVFVDSVSFGKHLRSACFSHFWF